MVARVGNPTRPLATIAGGPHTPARRNPAAPAGGPSSLGTPSRGREFRLWLQEPGQPTVWHIASQPIAYGWYRMACGWEHRPADAERLWPTRGGDPEPPVAARCRSCVQMHAVNVQLNLGLQRDDHESPVGIDPGEPFGIAAAKPGR